MDFRATDSRTPSPSGSSLSSQSTAVGSIDSAAASWAAKEAEKAFYPENRNSLRVPGNIERPISQYSDLHPHTETEEEAVHPEFPDGGFKAWSVTAGAWCCLFCSLGWISCIGVFQNYYSQTMLKQYSPFIVSWIPSIESFFLFFLAPVWGKLFDGYGPAPLLIFGGLIHVFGLMMTSLCTKYWQFVLAQSICSAAGTGAIFYAGNNACTTWWQKRRGFAMGIVSMGSSFAGVVMPIMSQNLFDPIGFPWTMRICAFVFLGLLIFANLTVHSRLDHHPKPWSVMEFIRPFKEPAFQCVSAASFFFFWGVFLPVNFIVTEAVYLGMSETLAEYMIPILFAGSMFGRVVPASIGDKVGRFNVMCATTTFSAVITLALWIPVTNNIGIIWYAVLFGFSSGTFLSMIPIIVAEISDVREIGVRNGSNFFVISIAMLTGSPIAALLVARDNGAYLYLQLYSGVSMLIGAAFFFAARTVQRGLHFGKI